MRKPKNSKKGSIAIEFALLLPFMLLMFFGSFELSRYIMVTRKIDNVSNDLGYVLSREGDLYSGSVRDGTALSNSFGANRLDDLARFAVPLLMYPYETNDYVVGMRYVGFPLEPAVGADASLKAYLRLMWAHKYCRTGFSSGGSTNSCTSGIDVNLTKFSSTECADPEVQTSDGTCIFKDNDGYNRAKVMLRGQGFILVDFAYPYTQILNNFANLPRTGGDGTWGLNFSGAKEKVSSYIVRSRWIDQPLPGKTVGDGIIQASEFTNKMHICWPRRRGEGCNLYTSNTLGSSAISTERKPCGFVTPASANSSGCQF